jgi:protein-disulfide isomerase
MARKTYILIILSAVLLLSLLIYNGIRRKNSILEEISTIPEFYFYDSIGNIVHEKELIRFNSPTVIFYFNSGCSLCKEEFYFIEKHLQEFKDAQLIFISTEDFEDIEPFAAEFNLWGKQRIHFLQDRELLFGTYFNLETVPSTLVYDHEGGLLGAFKGMIAIKKIIELVHDGSRKES